ncbi:LapA family protein [Mycolicibacterium frederiksbergense]|nr:lipopolysaccharide assembly protein LapA domain-containing protein [Mycolicibacterium frederiksbergense]
MTSDPSASPDLPEPTPGPPSPPEAEVPVPPSFTRAGALWSALILGFLVLIVLLIFIAQNTASTAFTFLSWHWSLPLGVAILGAAVAGGLLTFAAGTARIFQLRRAAKKNFKAAQRS